MMYSKDRDK